MLDFVFDLFIKAQTLFPYIISNRLILYSHKIFDILQPVTESVLFIQSLAKKLRLLLHDLVALTNLINLHYCKSSEDDIAIHTLIISAEMYTRSLLITQLWKLIYQQLKMIERNRFQILILDNLKVI